MNKKSMILSMLLAMVLFSVSVVAQELWSLEQCINYAFENNLTIKKSMLDVSNADRDLKQSKLNMVPAFNASVGQNFGWGRAPTLHPIYMLLNNPGKRSSGLTLISPSFRACNRLTTSGKRILITWLKNMIRIRLRTTFRSILP
ncbi:MAG: hypothetical protein DRI88_03935 [Bacteroidetes bacterium]|nr:MAG: hypothetical protein DRI88_03935 [Bacteroidota bacterium]